MSAADRADVRSMFTKGEDGRSPQEQRTEFDARFGSFPLDHAATFVRNRLGDRFVGGVA
ncbi:hypothetical protein [Kribbella sp.]|uniref:hypothetical protein n=1 Tax=Kribbella sp. TaxID=1871183 RepID=UPI002D4C4646|nr:hypothetical protein [Kribbella sp.]HZX06900.1 hypothetical protein [Kribbella sp.]